MSTKTKADDLLDLTDLAPKRVPVLLVEDGPLREMIGPSELGIEDRAKMTQIFERISAYSQLKKPAKKHTKQYDQDRKALVRMALPDATPAEIRKLNHDQLEAIAARFLVAFGNMISQVAKAIGSESVMELVKAKQEQ